MANMKKPAPKKPMAPKTPSKGVKTPMPKKPGTAPAKKTPMPKITTKKTERMTPQDAAMKKILEQKYGKIYG
jgi:hypothetical protein